MLIAYDIYYLYFCYYGICHVLLFVHHTSLMEKTELQNILKLQKFYYKIYIFHLYEILVLLKFWSHTVQGTCRQYACQQWI